MNQDNKQERIIKAAINLFSNQGFHQTTVSEIAATADVAKGTVYWYFDSKEQLFQEILLTEINKLNRELKTEVAKLKDPVKMLEAVIKAYFNFYDRGQKVAKMYRESTITIGQEFKEQMLEFNHEQTELIQDIIKAGQKEGLIRDNLKIKDTAYLIIGMVSGFHPHIYFDSEFDIEAKLATTKDLLFNGIKK